MLSVCIVAVFGCVGGVGRLCLPPALCASGRRVLAALALVAGAGRAGLKYHKIKAVIYLPLP